MEELNAMQQAFSDLVFYHAFFSAFFAFPFALNLFTLFAYKNFASLNKKIWYTMPLIFFLLSIAFLSGINVSITQNLYTSPFVIGMWAYWLFVLCGEIIRIKILKVARRTNEQAMLKYVRFCKILYSLNLLGFALLFFGSH
ncbi:hypothetical protein [Helicobacter pametensis]|uniref:hypothetical protein n=1 Tax=Helicobacter pametensis TaxID=95149 RepID=UPI0004800B1E|nr:hypothetical protein [Helicobacter pametensis]